MIDAMYATSDYYSSNYLLAFVCRY